MPETGGATRGAHRALALRVESERRRELEYNSIQNPGGPDKTVRACVRTNARGPPWLDAFPKVQPPAPALPLRVWQRTSERASRHPPPHRARACNAASGSVEAAAVPPAGCCCMPPPPRSPPRGRSRHDAPRGGEGVALDGLEREEGAAVAEAHAVQPARARGLARGVWVEGRLQPLLLRALEPAAAAAASARASAPWRRRRRRRERRRREAKRTGRGRQTRERAGSDGRNER